MSSRDEGYKFDIQNGVVVGVYEYDDGRFEREEMDWDETWTVESGRIVKNEYEDSRLEYSVYTDADGDGIYVKTGEYYGSTPNPPTSSTPPVNSPNSTNGYQFEVANGAVTAVYELYGGVRSIESIDANESWQVDGSTFIKTEYEYGLVSTSVYTDPDSDGIYNRASKTYGQANATSPAPDNSSTSSYGYADDGYRFDIANGAITAVYEIENGVSEREHVEPNETWSINADQIIHREYDHGVLKEKILADNDGDGIYTPIARSYAREVNTSHASLELLDLEDHLYQFDSANGVVQQAYEVSDGLIKPDFSDDNESWSIDGQNVIKTESEYGIVSKTVFSDADGDGLYERVSSTHQDSAGRDLPDSLDVTPLFVAMRAGVTEYVLPERFSGPSALNLQFQLIDSTKNAVLVGSEQNDFIKVDHDSSTGKAADGSGGNDVIDGGVGSAFITGGAGTNTFFLDGRSSGDAWSTVTDFKLGTDKATIWGFKAGVSSIAAIEENVGADGYKGLTLHFENLVSDHDAEPSDSGWKSITFADKTLDDFGVDSLDALNANLAADMAAHFSIGQVTDDFGVHDYLYIA
jgi:hypothetical protein